MIVNLDPQPAASSQITCVIGEATNLPHIPSNSFDIVHSKQRD